MYFSVSGLMNMLRQCMGFKKAWKLSIETAQQIVHMNIEIPSDEQTTWHTGKVIQETEF